MKRTIYAAVILGAIAVTSAIPTLRAQAGADAQKVVDAAYAKLRTLKEGKNADYIPALAKVDPNRFGIALVSENVHTPVNGCRAHRTEHAGHAVLELEQRRYGVERIG